MQPPIQLVDRPAAEALLHDGATLLDARSLRQRGLRFLSGAARVPWTATRTGGARSGLLPSPDALARVFEGAGVCWEHPVLVVGAGPAGWGEGARVAWSLAFLDHPKVSWHPLLGATPAGRGHRPATPRSWTGGVRPELRAPGGIEVPDGAVVVDVREAHEHQGAQRFGEARGGHIPGARFLGLHDLWTPDGVVPPDRVRQRARDAGIPLDAPLVCVCTGGVRSAAAAVLLQHAGVGSSVRNHDGGMWAWSADPSRPMARRPKNGSR